MDEHTKQRIEDHGRVGGELPAERPPVRSARDYSESKCCGRAPGSCPDCPLIVESAAETPFPHDAEEMEQSLSAMRAAFDRMHAPGDGGGLRYTDGKPQYEQIPPEALEALAWHYTQSGGPRTGPAKYPMRNWERGMAWLKCFGCIMRHSWKWMRGEDFDAETGSHHMIAVAWNAFALFTYSVRKIGEDDRPRV